MKKRYARILAATLSAAMVFTSAPVNFTGIDLGVIEAKAANNAVVDVSKFYTTTDDAIAAIDGVIKTGITWEKAYDGATVTTGLGTSYNSLDKDVSSIAGSLAAIGVDASALTFEVGTGNAGDSASVGKYTVTVKASAKVGATLEGSTPTPVTCGTYAFEIKEAENTTKITADAVKNAVEKLTFKTQFTGEQDEQTYAASAIDDVTKPDCVSEIETSTDTARVTEAKVIDNVVTITLNKDKYSPAGPGWTITGGVAKVNTTIRVDVYKQAATAAFAYTFPKEIKYTYNKANADTRTFTVGQITKYVNDDGDAYTPKAAQMFCLNADTPKVVVFGDGSSTGDAKAGTAGSKDWLVNADDLLRLSYASANTKMDLRLTHEFTDGKTVDYGKFNPTYADDDAKKNGVGTAHKTVSVEVVKGDKAVLNKLNTYKVYGTYTVGDSKIELDGADKAKFEIVSSPSDLSSLKVGTKKTIIVATVDKYPEDEFDVDDFMKADENSKVWDYSGEKFSKEVEIRVAALTLGAKMVDFPAKLAEGETVEIGDVIKDIKLETTDTCKYGKFYLVKNAANAAAGTRVADGDKDYHVVFEPDTDFVTLTASDRTGVTYGTWDGKDVYYKAFSVTPAKKAVNADEIKVSLAKAGNKDYKFGAEYEDMLDRALKSSATYDYKQESGKWTVKESGIMPIGETTITFVYTLKNSKDYAINEKASIEVPVKVNIEAPKFEAKVDGDQVVKVGKTGTAKISAVIALADDKYPHKLNVEGLLNAAVDKGDDGYIKYQWYSKANGKLYAGQQRELIIDASKKMSDTFWCEVTFQPSSKLTKAKKEAWAAILADGNTFTSAEKTVTVADMEVNSKPPYGIEGTSLKYGKIDATASLRAKVETGWTIESVTWKAVNKDTKAETEMTGTVTSAGVAKATIPTTLNAGSYDAVATITAKSDKGESDVVVYSIPFPVDKADLDGFDWTKITFDPDAKVITYGQKLSEIKFNPAKNAEKYGTYEYINDKVMRPGSFDKVEDFVRFIPNADAKANFNDFNKDDYNGVVTITGVDVQKGTITIKANDLTVSVGDLVSPSMATCTVSGLVGNDTLKNLDVVVDYEIDSAASTTKVGTIADAIKVKATKAEKVNEYIELDYYKVAVQNGNLIVKEAAPVVTPTPTPAPVKQATAAAPKAAKAKATVKVGKKYTLKLKYASAAAKKNVKKVTWKSSKKSVATVSSKGKVTAKKAGKATIAATITFKDGSKKKVKFKVTVK